MAPMEAIEGQDRDVDRKSSARFSRERKSWSLLRDRFFSFGLALVFAVIVWIVGKPVTDTEATTVIGYVLPDSPARSRSSATRATRSSQSITTPSLALAASAIPVMWRIVTSTTPTIPVVVERGDQQ